MGRKILGIKIKDKIPCKNIRQQTHIKDRCCLLRDKSGTEQVKLQGCRTTGGQKEPRSGNPGSARDQEADNLCDGVTVLRKQRGDYGTERLVTEIDGGLTRRATSCSGWTKPSRIVVEL
ncbi:hypothetical protein ElyMa_004764800 [Elysia marginata]|uniref:Uncharacterized protein n=1 Tax=Elysia marginata TaxID=1093978 RepID=A0AAV4IE01_9GAST|nr:hypothetical protein ElyMa_004764800 [Elysia marginata]